MVRIRRQTGTSTTLCEDNDASMGLLYISPPVQVSVTTSKTKVSLLAIDELLELPSRQAKWIAFR
jgi:hypothetical protein